MRQKKSEADEVEQVGPIVEQVRNILAGNPAHIQAAALADLLAIYLAGHLIRDSPGETEALRERLLDLHVEMVRRLIPINAERIHRKQCQDRA